MQPLDSIDFRREPMIEIKKEKHLSYVRRPRKRE
jgi:hypothetical protein